MSINFNNQSNASREIKVSEDLKSLSLNNLPTELIERIGADYFTFEDLERFSQVNKRIFSILNNETFVLTKCQTAYQRFETRFKELHPNFINLDKLGACEKLGLPGYKEYKPESIKSLKAELNFLVGAGLLAQLSEDQEAVIVTIPRGWSIKNLEEMSQAAVTAGITSAEIRYWDMSPGRGRDTLPVLMSSQSRDILEESTIQETQRVAISNTVLEGSRGKSIEQQKELLTSKKLEDEFPDLLLTLTFAVLRRILSQGTQSSYGRHLQGFSSFTRTNKKTPRGSPLCVCSTPDYVSVSISITGDNPHFGVGAMKIAPI